MSRTISLESAARWAQFDAQSGAKKVIATDEDGKVVRDDKGLPVQVGQIDHAAALSQNGESLLRAAYDAVPLTNTISNALAFQDQGVVQMLVGAAVGAGQDVLAGLRFPVVVAKDGKLDLAVHGGAWLAEKLGILK